MQRKVIQIANSTQLISLPRKWALENGVKKGDELEITLLNKDLLVRSPHSQTQEKKLEITIDKPERFLRRMLFSPYIQGYTEIRVNYKDPKIFELIADEVQFLMGYEIVTETQNYCVIKRVATALDNDLDNIISRIFMSTSTMMQDLIEAMRVGGWNTLENLIPLEGTNNKLSYFSLRIINSYGYKDKNKEHSIYYTILCVEEIVDDLRDLCNYLVKSKGRVDKSTLVLFERCLKSFRTVYGLFKKFDSELLFEFSNENRSLTDEIINRIRKNSDDAVVLTLLHSVINKISHISKEIHY